MSAGGGTGYGGRAGLFKATLDIGPLDPDFIVGPAALPNGEFWIVQGLFVRLITNVTAGNRTLTIDVREDTPSAIFTVQVPVVQGPSATVNYLFGPGIPADAAVVNTLLRVPIPTIVLNPGWSLRVYDIAGISAGDFIAASVSVAVQAFSLR